MLKRRRYFSKELQLKSKARIQGVSKWTVQSVGRTDYFQCYCMPLNLQVGGAKRYLQFAINLISGVDCGNPLYLYCSARFGFVIGIKRLTFSSILVIIIPFPIYKMHQSRFLKKLLHLAFNKFSLPTVRT
jgi:hypothetical protein